VDNLVKPTRRGVTKSLRAAPRTGRVARDVAAVFLQCEEPHNGEDAKGNDESGQARASRISWAIALANSTASHTSKPDAMVIPAMSIKIILVSLSLVCDYSSTRV